MIAVRLHGKDDLRVDDIEKPDIGDGEILLAVKAAFICGTDLRMVANGVESSGPITLGHELAGVIAAVGKGVDSRYREGARVSVAPNMGCGVCDECVSGNTQLCGKLRALGINLDGGFAELVRVPEDAVRQGNVALLGDGVSFDAAAVAEPFSCVFNAFERIATRPGESALVIGAGPIGLMHAKLQRLGGAGLVMMHDINEGRLAECRSVEPSIVTIGPDQAPERVMELTKGRGADIVVTATAAAAVQPLALRLAARNGRVVFFGGLPKSQENVTLNTNIIHYNQVWVTGTSRQNLRQYRTCLDLLARGLVDLSGIVSRTFALDAAPEAFRAVKAGEGLKSGFHV